MEDTVVYNDLAFLSDVEWSFLKLIKTSKKAADFLIHHFGVSRYGGKNKFINFAIGDFANQ